MSITTDFISGAFGKDIGSVFYPNPSTTTYPPPADTSFIANASDLSQQFLSIKYAPGTSTKSGFINSANDDLSSIFATGAPLSIVVTNFDSSCSYQTSSGATCCPVGGGSGTVSVAASGGYSSSYTYDWVVSNNTDFTFSSSTTDSLPFTFPCLTGSGTGTQYKANGTVTVTDANGNSVIGDWTVRFTVTSNA